MLLKLPTTRLRMARIRLTKTFSLTGARPPKRQLWTRARPKSKLLNSHKNSLRLNRRSAPLSRFSRLELRKRKLLMRPLLPKLLLVLRKLHVWLRPRFKPRARCRTLGSRLCGIRPTCRMCNPRCRNQRSFFCLPSIPR